MIRTEEGAVVGSIDVAALEAEQGEQADEQELSDLGKRELVKRAEAAGVDPKGMNKADLVAALRALEANDEPQPVEEQPQDDGDESETPFQPDEQEQPEFAQFDDQPAEENDGNN